MGWSRLKFLIISFITCITLDKSLNFLSAIIAITKNIKTTSQGYCETLMSICKILFKSNKLFSHIPF